ncbi:MAG: glycosyltransferase [Phycisphaerae bacterium]|jgi:glycosyltransferase involved in cell wall biosynthesis
MKILLATMQFGEGYSQGAERYVATLAEGLARRGHEPVILAGDPERCRTRLPLGALVSDDPRVLHYPTRGRWAVEGLSPNDLLPLLRRERPDVVHLVNPAHIGVGLVGAARALGAAVVLTVVDFWWLCPKHTLWHARGETCDARVPWTECLRCVSAGDPRWWVRSLAGAPLLGRTLLPVLAFTKARWRGTPWTELRRWTRRQALLREVLAAADAVIFLSQSGRALLGEAVPPERAHRIPVGLEARWWAARRGAPPAGPVAPESLTLGFAGALMPHKGAHVLLEALRRLGWTQTRVRIAGRGTDPSYDLQLRRLAEGLRAEIVGAVPSEQMPEFLAGLDLLVVPSIWPENQPQTVLEALAMNVPLVASRVAGVREVLPEDEYLFEPGSAESLAERLRAWCAAPRAASSAVCTADDMVDRTLDLYVQIRERR